MVIRKSIRLICVAAVLFFSIGATTAEGATLTWNVATRYGITQSGIASAITDARSHFASNPGDTIILEIDAGTYNIGGNVSHGINLSGGVDPGNGGRLIFQGAGMGNTTFVFTDTDETQIYGRNVYHLTFRDIHMTRAQYTVSQGTLVEVGNNYVDLDIHEGYPVPHDIVRWSAPQGLYLRRYTASKTDPMIITDGNNQQVPWLTTSYQISGQRWRMLHNRGVLSNYNIGEYVGIKSKHTGNTWFFTSSDDIVFENMKYTHSTRGVFRGGTSNVRFSGCRFERSAAINGQTPCLSSPAGGPQFSQPSDQVSTNMVVENCYIESTGDDCTAFFNVDGGIVKDCVFRDSFARGILMTAEASNIRFTGNTTVSRGPIQGAGDAGADAIAPNTPTGLVASSIVGFTTLSWDANTEPDLHYYQIYRSLDGVWWEYAITTDTNYEDVWAYQGQNMNYYIQAVDFSGNHSAPTATVPCDLNTDGDTNGDCGVDLQDFQLMADYWLQAVLECPRCDINGDGDINLKDYSAFSKNWL